MKYIFFFLLLISVVACKNQSVQKTHKYSFYYWRTTLELNQHEQQALQKATGKHLYVRYFDVDKINDEFKPIAPAIKKASFISTKEIVPVVYVTNQTLVNITENEQTELAKSIVNLVTQKHQRFGFSEFNELQIDCDWTNKTRDSYFKLLEELKKQTDATISVTLRLHQVKDREITGIPPVSKVYLMCYSTSSPLANDGKNSILELNVMKNYLANLQHYPIKNIEVALPIYSWGIIENHLGKHKLINGLSKNDLKNENFKQLSENEAIILKDGFYFGFFLNKDFKIKIEDIEEQSLDDVVRFLDSKMNQYNIVYYQLNNNFIADRNLTR